MTLNTLLIDDEQEALDSMEILLSEYPEINLVKKISNPLDVFPLLINSQIDLVFLDIKMPIINGIDLLEKIRECNPSLIVVIVTAYDNFALKAIKHNAFNYLLKPVSRIELASIVKQLKKCFQANSLNKDYNKVLITSKGNILLVDLDDIAYFEAEGNYTYVFLNNGSKIVASYNVGLLVNKFPEDMLVKINRSIYVNKDNLISINKKQKNCLVKLNNGEITLNTSAIFLREFNAIFNNA